MTKAERDAAKGQPCMNCHRVFETVVLAHYSGQRQHAFGKGRGIKGNDKAAAPQCMECHATGPFAEGYIAPGFEDAPREVRKMAKSEEQLYQIVMWHMAEAGE